MKFSIHENRLSVWGGKDSLTINLEDVEDLKAIPGSLKNTYTIIFSSNKRKFPISDLTKEQADDILNQVLKIWPVRDA